MSLDILSKHSKSVLDDMAVDIVKVQKQLKELPTEMEKMLAEQAQQLSAIAATHVQRLTDLSVTQRDTQAKAFSQGVDLLNEIVNSAKGLIEGQSKKERTESFYVVKKLRDEAIADLKAELGKVDGLVEGIHGRLDPALLAYQEKLSKAATATAEYCNKTVVEADKHTASLMETAAARAMQTMSQSIVGQMWTFIAVGAGVWLVAGGVGAWMVAKIIAP